jgi:hypothetical protein
MIVNYLIFGFTSLILAGTFFYYKYAQKKGIPFRYKPLTLLIVVILFGVSVYGIIIGKPYHEILPFIK